MEAALRRLLIGLERPLCLDEWRPRATGQRAVDTDVVVDHRLAMPNAA